MLVTAHSQRGAERKANQDTIGVRSWRNVNEVKDSTQIEILPTDFPSLFLLADGIGGHDKGGVASRTAVDKIFQIFDSAPDGFEISSAVKETDMALKLSGQHSYAPMGTTILGLVMSISRVHIFNLGDSNGYRLRGNEITQLTVEDKGGWGKVITQCLGGGSKDPKVHQNELEYQSGDKFVLTSDGVTDYVSDDQILSLVSGAGSEGASKLCEQALKLGSGDDLSAMVIDCAS